jgi:hypothetical protein
MTGTKSSFDNFAATGNGLVMYDVERERVGNGSVPFRVNFALVAFPSSASPSVKVTGVLKGYFLSPDGTLKVREIPFRFP